MKVLDGEFLRLLVVASVKRVTEFFKLLSKRPVTERWEKPLVEEMMEETILERKMNDCQETKVISSAASIVSVTENAIPSSALLLTTHPPVVEIKEAVKKKTSPNRSQRRAADSMRRKYEKERMKFDKFVEPGGPEPIKVEREIAPPPPKDPVHLEPVTMVDDPNDILIVDELIEGDETEVLFEESEFYGEYNFRDSILDQLDKYWVYLERMKMKDPDAYGFYKVIGATLIPRLMTGARNAPVVEKMTPEEVEEYKREIWVPTWFNLKRPAFGCLAIGTDPLTESREKEMSKKTRSRMWLPRFMYFVKYDNPPPDIQPMVGGDTYKMTVWWDDNRRAEPSEFGIFVSSDGKIIQPLRVLEPRKITIKKKRKPGTFSFYRHDWHIPEFYKRWAEDHGLTAEIHMAHLFTHVIQNVEYANLSMIRVEVMNGDLTASFGVNVNRMAYFFQDRDIQLTANGTKQRIFHVVKPHVRSDGRAVKMHFRGLREFEWAGYRVKITVPGKDHFMLSEVNVGLVDEHWQERDEKYITEPQFAEKLHKWMNEGIK